MHGLSEPHPDALRSTMLFSSAMVGKRQSQWLLKPPVIVLPSALTQLPTPAAPPLSVLRKLANAGPSGAVPELLHVGSGVTPFGPRQGVVFFFPVRSRVRKSVC